MSITNTQRGLMEHTVSGCNRNWFGTNSGCKDAKEFDRLVSLGYATKRAAPDWSGDDVIYSLTKKGKEAL